MRALLPLLSLGKDTARSNPLQSTSSHCKINRSSWPNKTQISENKYDAITIKIEYLIKANLIINSQFTGSQQTHRKESLHQIDLQETIVFRYKERESHLATAYKPVGLQ